MSLEYQPFAKSEALRALDTDLGMNISEKERDYSAVAGATLLVAALSARSRIASMLWFTSGTLLLARAVTGRCEVLRALGLDRRHHSSGVPGNGGVKVEHAIEIRRSPEVLYKFWRSLEDLPKVLRHVRAVRRLSERRSHWEVDGLLGQAIEWEAEIINDEPDHCIAWASLPGAKVQNAGSVWFERTLTNATVVKVVFQFDPPAGAVGAAIASALGTSPLKYLQDDMEQFREFAERELNPTS